MIVDDEPEVRELLFRYLASKFRSLSQPKKSMPEIVLAKDAEDAWKILQSGAKPSLMIIDYQMPQMNGVQLIDKIQTELPQINPELVIYSGYCPAEAEAEKRGCRFILKTGGGEEIFKLAVEGGLFTA